MHSHELIDAMESLKPSIANASDWMAKTSYIPSPNAQSLPYLVAALITLIVYARWDSHIRKMPPLINPPKIYDPTYTTSKIKSVWHSGELMRKAEANLGHDKPYSIVTLGGPVMVLPAKYAHEIRNDDRLSFSKFAEQDFHAHLPGFEVFQSNLTDTLAKVVKKHFTKLSEWQEYKLEDICIQLASRMSARFATGEELCRNEDWLRIFVQYTVNAAVGSKKLCLFPKPIRFLINRFLPESRTMRAQLAEARALMRPIIDKRAQEKRDAVAKGEVEPRYDDVIEWAEEEVRLSDGGSWYAEYEPALFQLHISAVALHSMSGLLAQTMINILLHPDLMPVLRKEINDVVGSQGWSRSSLHKLRLMDSVLKETMRLKPLERIVMNRIATSDVQLSDGTLIPKSTHSVVANTTRLDPSHYPNPDKFDPYRFVRMRADPDQRYKALMVSTGIESLSFGYGQHVCPGRFLATDVVKIALCHLLLKYDIKLAPGVRPKAYVPMGFFMSHDRSVRVMVRRRSEEVDLDSV